MRLGLHLSISGGMAKMAETAVEVGCEAVQIFSRSPRGGIAKALDIEDVEKMKAIFTKGSLHPLVVHAPYFVNLGNADPEKRESSVDVLREELKRADTLGASYVVCHPGHRGKDEDHDSLDVLNRVAQSIHEILDGYRGTSKLIIENTPGTGRQIGQSLEAMATLLDLLPHQKTGMCLDTCHAFSAGYDIRGRDGAKRFIDEILNLVGTQRVLAIHLNDSKEKLGSKIDRHAHMGHGEIGREGIGVFINSLEFPFDIPGILETPQDYPGAQIDNLSYVKNLRDS